MLGLTAFTTLLVWMRLLATVVVEETNYLRQLTRVDVSYTQPPSTNDTSRWFWIGLVRDARQVSNSTWNALAQAACQYHMAIHVTVALHADLARTMFRQRTINTDYYDYCAPVYYFETEADLGLGMSPPSSNRVTRIAAIRDAQRQRIRQLSHNMDVVIVADLDLRRLPPVSQVVQQGPHLLNVDAVCAAGITLASRDELWYYDTFATVLLPDTFVHPLSRRLVPRHYPGENTSLVRSNYQHGSFTQGDLMRYLQQQQQQHDGSVVPVRSCFGGLAVYRAAVWLEPACQYTLPPNHALLLQRYASHIDGVPCEHVAFHACLQDTPGLRPARIAINPSMLTLWRKD